MTGSKSKIMYYGKKLIPLSIAVFCLVTLPFTQVNAQSAAPKPTSLAPAKVLAPTGSVAPSAQPLPAAKSLPAPASLAPPPTARALVPLAINVEELQEIDNDSVGTLTEEQGGIGINMWQGTSRALVEKLLPKLPASTSSRSMRELMRRLLVSTAKSPQIVPSSSESTNNQIASIGAGNLPPPGQAKGDLKQKGKLLSLRMERLLAMGDIAAVDGLLKVAPNRETDPGLLN